MKFFRQFSKSASRVRARRVVRASGGAWRADTKRTDNALVERQLRSGFHYEKQSKGAGASPTGLPGQSLEGEPAKRPTTCCTWEDAERKHFTWCPKISSLLKEFANQCD